MGMEQETLIYIEENDKTTKKDRLVIKIGVKH